MIKYEVEVNLTGTKKWFLNGKLHREDGPAIEYSTGTKKWYLNDKSMSEADHKRATEIIDGVREYEGRIVELEVKLAKAVEALAELATDEHPKGWIAIAAYNELKGQK